MIQRGKAVAQTVYIDSRYSREPIEAVLKRWEWKEGHIWAVCRTSTGIRYVGEEKLFKTREDHQKQYRP